MQNLTVEKLWQVVANSIKDLNLNPSKPDHENILKNVCIINKLIEQMP